jgi:hypothetical protein
MYKISHVFVKKRHTSLEAEEEENVNEIMFIIHLQNIMPNLYIYIYIYINY